MAREWNNLKQASSAGTQAMLAVATLDILELDQQKIIDDDFLVHGVFRPEAVQTELPASEHSIITMGINLVSDKTTTWSPTLRNLRSVGERTSEWAYSKIVAFPFSVAQTIVMELGRLKAGWAGEGSVAPGGKVLLDIQNAAASFPVETSIPEIEIDPDDGSVVLRWISQDADRTVSLTFLGKGEVTFFYSSPDSGVPARKYKVTDIVRLYNRCNDDPVLSLMAG